jgi:hypothetical protein
MILFVQPFGLGSPGGGSRILRALMENAPLEWLSVAVTPDMIPALPFGQELQVRGRPFFGRLEKSRFVHWFQKLDWWSALRLRARLDRILEGNNVNGVHAIAHNCWDSIVAFRVAKRNDLPFFLSVHDDPVYCLQGHPLQKSLLDKIGEIWRKANARVVISEEMGEELCRRWGKRDYVIVTDGIEKIEEQPHPVHPNRLAVYFMGLLHISYEPNFVALQKALRIISEENPGLDVSLTLRGGTLPEEALVAPELVRTLPFGNESQVRLDLKNADLLYQPLSLEAAHRAMSAYSLSTKMITYLGSGLPIFFHGPSDSAAGKLLKRSRAAFVCDSVDPAEIGRDLMKSVSVERDQVVLSALNLATKQFRLSDVRERFWNVMLPQL